MCADWIVLGKKDMSTALDVQMPLPTGSLEAYITAVNSVPILSLEKEKALATSFRET